ncbi:FAD-dependent oxidoreductase [Sphingomicrobium sediminis]|uniref:FAD-dependent monooxygenase n=1 Tax=Sphingomicrobium sediminis TaxID=2950949 RepID=A0A9X2J2T8_9SPHN|nr:NAD(P)/FAD-dependent oxidoreductase [Sphingomicrobium sediminis]MCM8558114.1 FAD-dependent monooxygenase [Sphingomicrobium sediminis]
MRGGGQLHFAIAGAGVGGLASAILLARQGHRVNLFDQLDAPRPTGSGLMLQPTGLAVLDAMGLGNEARSRGARITRLHGKAGKRTVLDVQYERMTKGADAVGIHRSALFDLLWTAAQAEAIDFAFPRRVIGASQRHVEFAHGEKDGPFDLVIDASGARSAIAQHDDTPLPYGAYWATVDWHEAMPSRTSLSQRYRQARQMAGLLPVGRVPGEEGEKVAFFWSVRGDQAASLRDAGVAALLDQWAGLWPETADIAAQVGSFDRLTLARYAHHTMASPIGDGVVHLGDSWHSTSPQLGQGANMALLDAFALAKTIETHRDLADALSAFVFMRQDHVRLYQLLSHLLTPVYQSDGWFVPTLRDWLVGPVSRVGLVQKIQARLVSGLVGRPLSQLGL